MKNFKAYTIAAMLAGVMALPVAAANAEGYSNKGASAGASAKTASQTFQSLDADKSGSLSEAEFDKQTTADIAFDDADANSDGRITLSELQTARPANPTQVPNTAPDHKPAPMTN